MKNILILLFTVLAFTSCEKVVDIDYKDNQPTIVIEGNITNEAGPYFVKISKSISLQEPGPYPAIDNAIVTISDNAGNSETLSPQGNGIYRTSTITGVQGRTYTLTVNAQNQTYTAQSTMPNRVPFDSVKVDEITVLGETEYNLIPVYRDPVEKGNRYRFLLSVNDDLLNQHFVRTDDIKNDAVNTFPLNINDDDLKLIPGDLITITMQCIDKNVASYYTALAQMARSGPGGGTTPNNPPTNISNGALGIFSAYTVETKNTVIP